MKTRLLSILAMALICLSSFAGKKPTLKDAVMGQDFNKVKIALEAGADPNEQWSSAPALMWAAIQGRIDVIQLLIDKGAQVDGTGLMGITALGSIIDHPKNPEDYVAENNKLNEKILKNFSVEKAKASGWYKETDISVFSTPAERAKVLIEAGADPNFLLGNMSVKEWTPFLTAVDKGYLDLVKVMLDTKKVDTEFRFHQWSEGVVSFANYVDVGKFEKSDRSSAQKWANVPKFNTPLLFAVEKNNLELVKILVEGGANTSNGKKVTENEQNLTQNSVIFYYKSPLDIAIDLGFTDIIDYLKSKGAIRYQN